MEGLANVWLFFLIVEAVTMIVLISVTVDVVGYAKKIISKLLQ